MPKVIRSRCRVSASSPLFRLLGGGASHVDVAPDLAEQAALVLRYLAVFGDNPKATAASTDVDRRVLEAAVSMSRGSGQVNDTEAGRQVGISHSQARNERSTAAFVSQPPYIVIVRTSGTRMGVRLSTS